MTLSLLTGTAAERMQNALLWLITLAHVTALASLLLVLGGLSTARAETSPSCNGTNLLDQLKAEEPATFNRILDEGEQVPNGKGIFWKIEKQDLPPSYLLGTMHVTHPRVLKLPAGADAAFASSRTVVVESAEVLDDKKAMAGLLTKPELTMFTDGQSIESLLDADDLRLLEQGLKARGIPLSAVSRMKPWMLMAFISLPACEMERKARNDAFLDKRLAMDAVAQGKTVAGLETYVEQLSAMASIPVDIHMKSLVETIKLGPKMADVFETMTELYLAGDIGLTIPLLKQVAPDGSDEQGYAQFEELIVTKRNHLMAERAAPLLAQGNVFMAVGALHLPGQEGLVELLKRQGFRVSAMK